MSTPDMDVIKEIPGYKVILKAILKSQIQQLVEQLASTTDEESVILTASVSDGTLCHLGSDSGKSFLEDHEDFKSQFLGFCLKRHHRRKQEQDREKEREKERQEALRNIPTTPPRFAGPRQGFIVRSPRFPSPRQQGPHPVVLTRVSPGMNMRAPGLRHEPYPMNRPPKRPLSFDGQGRGPGPSQPSMRLPLGNTNQVIKIEPDDQDEAETGTAGTVGRTPSAEGDTSHSSSPSQFAPPEVQAKTERDDDAKSESSSSTIPNDSSDLKFSDTAPPEGLSLDSDLSNLIPPVDNAGSDNTPDPQTPTSAPQTPGSSSGLDQGVNVKVEAITESEMELEITGVELGPRPPVPDTMVSQDHWGENMAASGSQADLQGNQMGYKKSEHGNYVCAQCGKVYQHKRNLTIHERQHSGSLPFNCCGMGFASSRSLQRHRCAVHGEEKPFTCRTCGKGFAAQCDLTSHQLREERHNALSCGVCGHTTSTRADMTQHIHTHSLARKQTCISCGARFKHHSSLSRHMKTMHAQW